MTLRPIPLLTILLCAVALSACSSNQTPTGPGPDTPPTSATYWVPPAIASWQIQLTGPLDTTPQVDIFFLDLFDTPAKTIAALRARGTRVICHFSAGTYESGRPDAAQFPPDVLGNTLPERLGASWLDIRNLQILAPLMLGRINLAVQKGCDGISPAHMDGYLNNTGFPLTPEDQLAYNIFLANAAHQNGLAIGLNDSRQTSELVTFFEWAVDTECFTYNQCDVLTPFAQTGKPVFVIEYGLDPGTFCSQANAMNFNALHKRPELDAYLTPCR